LLPHHIERIIEPILNLTALTNKFEKKKEVVLKYEDIIRTGQPISGSEETIYED
jgi:hypothetical protein